MPERFPRWKEAANYVQESCGIPCSPNWLAKLASVGGGPLFRKAGRFPLYSRTDLDAWANARMWLKQSFTSVRLQNPTDSMNHLQRPRWRGHKMNKAII